MDKGRLSECIDKVGQLITEFLKDQGGYSDGYRTYISGRVSVDEHNKVLYWSTPKALEELTPKGIRTRGEALNEKIIRILEEYGIDSLDIVKESLEHDSYFTHIVYTQEIMRKRVLL